MACSMSAILRSVSGRMGLSLGSRDIEIRGRARKSADGHGSPPPGEKVKTQFNSPFLPITVGSKKIFALRRRRHERALAGIVPSRSAIEGFGTTRDCVASFPARSNSHWEMGSERDNFKRRSDRSVRGAQRGERGDLIKYCVPGITAGINSGINWTGIRRNSEVLRPRNSPEFAEFGFLQ